MLDSHYAPRTPLRLMTRQDFAAARRVPGRVAALLLEPASLDPKDGNPDFAATRFLSASGDLVEAAASLFALMHELDALGFDEIWAERVPETGLGPAINDRLYKASRK
jgi:L-threonylcarbamoyladenylate synthase